VIGRPRVLVCCNSTVRRDYVSGEGLARLERLADWEWLASEGTSTRPGVWGGPSDDAADAARLRAKLADGFDALIVCHGSPYVDGAIFDAAPRLRFVGELEGDRFANRVDVEAAIERGVRVVDTTHGSSPAHSFDDSSPATSSAARPMIPAIAWASSPVGQSA
jgi:hypothetical protein